MTSVDEEGPESVDQAAVRHVLERHPVRLGVLFGSHVRDRNGPQSDVDVAVEFDESLSGDQRRRTRLDLIVDLSQELDTDDIDVSDLDGIRPEVGARALEEGVVLVGDSEYADRLRAEFERQSSSRTHDERMEQFDEILTRLEEKV